MLTSNSHQVFRPKSNENSILPLKNNSMVGHGGGTSKTPAASSKQRKALGDISNRKQGEGGLNNGNGGVKLFGPKKTPGLRLQLQPQQQQRNPLSTKTPKLLSKKKEVTFLPRPTTQSKQASSTVNIFPGLGNNNSTKSATQRPSQKSVLKNKLNNAVAALNDGPVDDIERPAGRLWVDQQHDDDDSCTSLSLPELNWEAAAKKRRDIRVQRNLEQEAREDESYDKYIEKLFEDDESSAIIGADVWIERTLSFDEDFGDELTFDAPSFCGDISF